MSVGLRRAIRDLAGFSESLMRSTTCWSVCVRGQKPSSARGTSVESAELRIVTWVISGA